MKARKKAARASLKNLYRIFTVPESPESTLGKIDREISNDLMGFLHDHIVATRKSLADIESEFSDSTIPEEPWFVSQQTEFLMQQVVAQSVHTASPRFIGHMTTALPYFMLPLSRIMVALNQNLVKTETSKAFTPLERQVLGMLHRLVFGGDDDFYARHMHDSLHALGAFCSGGTVANLTALWVARNRAFAADGDFPGIAQAGVHRACEHYGCRGAAIMVSKLGHYSLSKASDVLGFGRDQVVSIDTDERGRIDLRQVRDEADRLIRSGIKLVAIVGVAGTTETGSVDDLDALADIALECGSHFHVDAAWGGPTLFSDAYRDLLRGIERADSVTLDAHKQLYVPIGAGMVVFREPAALSSIEHHANYVIRPGSRDLGATTLEGSRPGMAMLVHSGLKILGRRGYGLLIDQGIEKARDLAEMIRKHPDFELITAPVLNILTYRYVPAEIGQRLRDGDERERARLNEILNRLTREIQVIQREAGVSFVSRTQLEVPAYPGQSINVLRVVLANPLTTPEILREIMDEQQAIGQSAPLQNLLAEARAEPTARSARAGSR